MRKMIGLKLVATIAGHGNLFKLEDLTMKKLTRYEELVLEAILKREKRRIEEFLETNNEGFDAYFAKNETLPAIESILEKFEN